LLKGERFLIISSITLNSKTRRRGYFSSMLDKELRSGIGGWYNIVAPDDYGIKTAIGCYT
jgi:hypothetical protein